MSTALRPLCIRNTCALPLRLAELLLHGPREPFERIHSAMDQFDGRPTTSRVDAPSEDAGTTDLLHERAGQGRPVLCGR
jgi:hypothetical protein